jgi:predicted unusual protein kinase regulating ubiquinone biosynthesis (AarF/ABC1/UbiB family)
VRESIDSDIDNLAFLTRNLGIAPREMDLGPLFEEARRQLHQEADYETEARYLDAYRQLIGDDPDFVVPAVHRDLTTGRVLAMDFVDGVSIDRLAGPRYSRAERDRAASLLCRLVVRELFDFALVQTDPNFGNFLYEAETGRIALLDLGAASPVPPALAESYRELARAAIAGDRDGLREVAVALGYVGPQDPARHVAEIVGLIQSSAEILRPGTYDFGTSDLFERLFTRGRDLYRDDVFTRLPDPAAMFLHRKFVGIFMLCRRLRARVDLRAILDPYL